MNALAGAVDASGLFVAAVAAVLGGGLVSAFVTFRKAKPEIEAIAVSTLKGVIEEMRAERERDAKLLAERDRLIGELRHRINKVEDGQREVSDKAERAMRRANGEE